MVKYLKTEDKVIIAGTGPVMVLWECFAGTRNVAGVKM